jgi:dolichol-phosphate mannosyltransferase
VLITCSFDSAKDIKSYTRENLVGDTSGNHGSQRLLVIVPTYNEVDNVEPLILGIFSHTQAHVLFVDDNSTDGTRDVIRRLMAGTPDRIFMLERPGKMGLGTAYVAGFKWAMEQKYHAVVEMDADLSHRAEDLKKIIDHLASYPVVVGSRYIENGGTLNWGIGRQLISRGGSLYARLILGIRVRDLTGGFNGWRMSVLQKINPDSIRSEGYTFQIELKFRAHLAGFSIREIPIVFVERRAGKSKMSGGIVFEAIYRVWQLALARRHILTTMEKTVVTGKADASLS